MATSMEVDPGKSVMAVMGASGSVSVALHPLVIMNISEHWTRVRAQEGKAQQGEKIGETNPNSQLSGSLGVPTLQIK
ncbi:hypothetical protein DPMN_138687 [Dreissena polymorpha]|uniref:Uncharacterized protein n=1 Tax=Dreissena polymorpha TaxID=45954 RepID=A0A9D4G4Y5_DREPO|nr:hypothetical protein DPMN_138687 [Dreissena polymorpha]